MREMAKAKSKVSKTAETEPKVHDEWQVGEDDDLSIGDTNLTPEQRRLLGSVSRFLLNISERKLLPRALRAGYSEEEHGALWELHDVAAGRQKPLAKTLGADLDPVRKELLVEIDQFENLWFRRIPPIIERYVPEEHVEAFLSEFFKDLVQQPLGPGVLDSVSKLLDRVDGLANSSWPGAAQVLKILRKRNFTEENAASMRAKIKTLREKGGITAPVDDAKVQANALAQQLAAATELRKVWNDWSTMLRPIYNGNELLQLGLATRTGGGAGGSDEEEPIDEGSGNPSAN